MMTWTNKKWSLQLIAKKDKYISVQHFVLLLSFVVGISCALASYLLKTVIHQIQHFAHYNIEPNHLNFWNLLYPTLGVFLSFLFVRYIVKDEISHGVTRILYAISQRKSILKIHNTWSSIVGSALTIGFGGSVGAESPIVLTGSAIGSNLGKFFKLDQKTLMLLISCGAAGAISGIFKAPITGLVFTLEVLMLDMTFTAVIPILISSVTATSLSYILTGNDFTIQLSSYDAFNVERIPHLIVLGIIAGLVSLYFTRGMNWLEGLFRKIKSPYLKLSIGGVTLSGLVFLFPPLYGEGYNTINALLNGNWENVMHHSLLMNIENPQIWITVIYFALIIIFKVVASAVTNSAGGVGGIFAPSLFMGAIVGFLIATIMNQMGMNVPTDNFALAGMSGLMSGVMHAPLTGIFLIAELTGGYNLFLTLMIVSTVSYLTIKIFEPHSLYSMRLAQKGKLITHHKDRSVLVLMRMNDVIETDFCVLTPKMKLGEFCKQISKSHRNVFPVVSPNNNKLLGIVTLDEVRNIMFRPELYDRFTIKMLMISPPATLNHHLPMGKVMEVFEDSHAWNLPVVDDEKRYIGFVSKSKIFHAYREMLVKYSDE